MVARRRRLRKGEVEPNPTRVALPLDSIQRVSYSTGESDSENYLSGTTSCDDTDGDTDGENLIGSDSGLAADKGVSERWSTSSCEGGGWGWNIMNYLNGTTSCDDISGGTDRENLFGSDSGLAVNEGVGEK